MSLTPHFAQQQSHLIMSIMRPSPHIVAGIFYSSPCPEPGPLTFMAFTALSIVWVFYQLCLSPVSSSASLQSHCKNESNNKSFSNAERIIASLVYATFCGILLLDGCWLATIYAWGIKLLSKGTTRGILDFIGVAILLALHFVFLSAGFVLWV
ncbi:hypothetical protein F5Y09DRAFT_304890 [Xylaria sp. FL1042]|nr:hypothetical protein F5Y09DRAFT_304890 [Xylaria sp. FL1042]